MTAATATLAQRLATLRNQAPVTLVSAAAGAGKTKVLTDRIVQRLVDGGVEPHELLVLTFTNEAADHLKVRLAKALRERLRGAIEQGDDRAERRITKALQTLREATMGTIHAFCRRLLLTYASDLIVEGQPLLDPAFYVLSDDARSGLLDRAVEETLETLYADASACLAAERAHDSVADAFVATTLPYLKTAIEPFAWGAPMTRAAWFRRFVAMTRALDPGYDDSALAATLKNALETLRSMPQYEARVLALADDSARPFLDRRPVKRLRDMLIARAREVHEVIGACLAGDAYVAEACAPKAGKQLVAFRAALEDLYARMPSVCAALEGPSWWDATRAVVADLPVVTLPKRSKSETQGACFAKLDETVVPFLVAIGGQVKPNTYVDTYVPDACVWLDRPQAEVEAADAESDALRDAFIATLLIVERHHRALKRKAHAVDFSDLEHETCRALGQADVREALATTYRDLYVDEYQDTSSVQEAILNALPCATRFYVGDVKQSIYSFRYANPDLFVAKLNAFSRVRVACEADRSLRLRVERRPGEGEQLVLTTTFRSRQAIIDVVNRLFSQLMSHADSEVLYDDDQRLQGPPSHVSEAPGDVRLIVVGAPAGADTATLQMTSCEREAAAVAVRLRSAFARGTLVPSDVAVLARKHDTLETYRKVFDDAGLPVEGHTLGVFDALEVRLLEALFEVLVNDKHDRPLAAVLRSPLMPSPLTETELLQVRNDVDLSVPFFVAVQRRATQTNDALGRRLAACLERLATWRRASERLSVRDLIERILSDCAWRAFLAHTAYAAARLDALERFLAYVAARDLQDLESLLDAIRRQRQPQHDGRQNDLRSDDKTVTRRPNVIRFLTIHGAKGLEFPHVVLVGLAQRFNTNRKRSPVLIGERHGVTLAGTLAHRWHVKDSARETSEERIRLLYVAMTRAERSLWLVAAPPGKASWPKDDDLRGPDRRGGLRPARQRAASSYLSWLVAAWRVFDDDAVTRLAAGETSLETTHGLTLERLEAPLDVNDASPRVSSPTDVRSTAVNAAEVAMITRRLSAHAPVLSTPSKMTVSELKRLSDHQDEDTFATPSSYDAISDPSDMAYALRRPDQPFARRAADLGTALHTVFRFLPLVAVAQSPHVETYNALLDRWVRQERLSPAERDAVAPFAPHVLAFATSSLARRLCRPGVQVHRETPFTLAAEHPQGMLVQGTIDLWYEEPDGTLGLVDFKSDALTMSDPKALADAFAARYRVQLDWYARAIERAFGKKVDLIEIWAVRACQALTMRRG